MPSSGIQYGFVVATRIFAFCMKRPPQALDARDVLDAHNAPRICVKMHMYTRRVAAFFLRAFGR